jgi:hypothetical protein
MLSIIADDTLSIAHHVRYEVDPRGADRMWGGPDDQMGVNNVVGLVSWNGDVVVDTPDGFGAVDLHLSVMLPNVDGGAGGEFKVARHDTRPMEGVVALLGGAIETTAGPFGADSGGVPIHGYTRSWSHDRRFALTGLTPPLLPTLPRFIVVTGGVGFDRYTWRHGR